MYKFFAKHKPYSGEIIPEERLSAIKSSVLSRVNQSEEDIPMKKHFSVKPLIIAAAISTTAVASLITANAASDLSTDKHITEETQPNITQNDTTAPTDTDAEKTQPDLTENDTTTPNDTTEDESTYKRLPEIPAKYLHITVDGQKTTAEFQSYKHDDGKESSYLLINDSVDPDWGIGFYFDGGNEVLDNLQNSGEPLTYETSNGKTVTIDFLPNGV